MKKYKVVIQYWNKRLKVFEGTKQVLNVPYSGYVRVIEKWKENGKVQNEEI